MAERRPVTSWKIEKLRPHPRQNKICFDVTDAELAELANDIATNGLLQPIEILGDGRIVAGHQRVRAAKKLGWTEIDAIVRTDLEKEGEFAIERYFITSNCYRRQLDPLGQARAYKALRELPTPKNNKLAGQQTQGDFRDQIGALLGMSGRSLDRILRVLNSPIEVQRAFSQNQITLLLAGKVAGLCRDAKEEIAQQIRNGANPKKVVEEFVKEHEAASQLRAAREHRRFIKQLCDILKRVPFSAETADSAWIESDIAVLVDAKKLIESRLKVGRAARKRQKRLEDHTLPESGGKNNAHYLFGEVDL